MFRECIKAIPKICSGEIFKTKVLVPCDPVSVLNSLYGKDKWMIPQNRDYSTSNLITVKLSENIEELPYMFRYYRQNGTLDVNRSIIAINNYYFPLTGKELQELSDIDFDLK